MTVEQKQRGTLAGTVFSTLLLLICLSGTGRAEARQPVPKSYQNEITSPESERTFVVHAPVRTLEEFREIAEQATRLKPFGKVEVNISALAEKAFHEIPEGRNYWYEYASYNPTPFKFFPEAEISPYIPAEFVKKNRDLLLGKAEILRGYGLGAAFWSYEPNFLPDEFFEAFPQMRGPRVDHPRRSNHPAFAPDIHVDKTRKMYINMVAELIRKVPELNTFFFKTNDAGSGICWSDWLYTGPNGPVSCEDYNTGERVATLMNTFKDGASKVGKDINIYLTGSMFTEEEREDIYRHLPENTFFQSGDSPEVQAINSPGNSTYPVRGILNPFSMLRRIGELGSGDENNLVFVSFRNSYDRGYERPEVMDKVLAMIEHHFASLSDGNERESGSVQQANYFCEKWAEEQGRDKLCEAFRMLDEANRNQKFGSVSGRYWGVSTRHITRPLVIAPDRLSAEEENYFLPYVFNVSEKEARMDYLDIHGARRSIPEGTVKDYISRVATAIERVEEASVGAPEQDFLENLAKALKIYNSILRSSGNFAAAQKIRDHNAQVLSSPPQRPDKEPTWEGHPDFQKFNRIMRDELDNTTELIALLEAGGMELIGHAEDPEYEDTFVLGPGLIEQLQKKRKIMLRHWRDIEGYLASPLK